MKVQQVMKDFENLTYILETEKDTYNKHDTAEYSLWTKDTLYDERVELFSDFLDVVREMRVALIKELAFNYEFEIEFWREMKALAESDFARFVLIFLNMFFVTYNPMFDMSDKNTSETTPFIVFKFQYDMLKDVEDFNSLIVLKPRGFGFTWLKVGLDLVRMMFLVGWQGLVISRVEADLDITGDRHQTIFGRLRFAIDNLPFTVGTYGKDKQRFIKLLNGSQYTGKSSNIDAARSMRTDEVEIEEAGVMKGLTKIVRSTKSVSRHRIIGGSVQGTDNGFYELYQAAMSSDSHKIVLWEVSKHPLYSAPDWLERERISYGDDVAGFNQEVLVNWFAGILGQVFVTLTKTYVIDRPEDFVLSDPYWIKCSSMDIGFGTSPTSIWLYMFNTRTRTYFYTGYLELRDTNIDSIIAQMDSFDYLDAYNFIDEYGVARGKDGHNVVDMLIEGGMPRTIPVSNKKVLESCMRSNRLIAGNKVLFDKDGYNIVTKNDMKVTGFDKLRRYRYNNKTGIDRNSKGIIDKDGHNDDAGDSFRYSHSASYYFGNGFTEEVDEEIYPRIT